jgi:aminoglycoside 2'-N-acetyltransferase I
LGAIPAAGGILPTPTNLRGREFTPPAAYHRARCRGSALRATPGEHRPTLTSRRMSADEFVIQVAHTADIRPVLLAEARALLDIVFDGEMTDHDWEHALGGMHALGWHGAALVGHASVIQRRLLHDGRALRTGYVEGVGVHPAWQRQGLGGRMMSALEHIIGAAYDIGALGATDEAVSLYEHRGWIRWLGPTSALTPSGIVRTPDEDDCIYVLPAGHHLDITGELTCDWRDGDAW